MRVNRLVLKIIKHYLNKSGDQIVANKPDFEGYIKFLDCAPEEGCQDCYRYDVILAKPENRLGITLVDVHGGAYVYSTRRHNHTFMNFFLERGFDIVLLDYPLGNGKIGPKEQFGAIYEQFQHFATHMKEYGVGEKLFLTGDSAGGHYALLLAEALTLPSVRENLGKPSLDNLNLQGILLSCPVYDYVNTAATKGLTKYVRHQMFGPECDNLDLVKAHCPRTNFKEFNLPIFVSSCRNDFIGFNSKLLDEDSKALGKDLTYLYLDSDNRKVDHVHNLTKMDLPESLKVNQAMVDFMLAKVR